MSSLLKRSLPAAAILFALAPAHAGAATLTVSPAKVARTSVHFKVDGVKPQQILSGRLSTNGRRRAVKLSVLRAAARRGTLRVSRSQVPTRRAVRSSLRQTKLVIVADTTPPTPPAKVVVQAAQVSWGRSSDDVKLRGYEVFRDSSRLKLTTELSFTDVLGGTGGYKVRAVDAAGNASAFSMPPTSPLPAGSGGAPSWRCGWGTFDVGRLPGACWRPFADDSFLNTPLPPAPKLVPTSAAMVSMILDMGEVPRMPINPAKGDDWFHPYFFSRPTDPVYRVVCNKAEHDCPIENMELRIPAQARPAESSDGHMSVIDQSTGIEWDFYDVQTVPLPANGGDIVVGWGGKTRMDGPGGGTRETESAATMAALGSTAGIIRYSELEAGQIHHALFLVVGCSNGGKVFPGRDVGGVGTCDENAEGAPASGQWLRLNMSDAEIAALPVSPWQKTILRTFARYGGFVGDNGSRTSVGFQIESPQTYTALGMANPWVDWAKEQIAAGDKNVDVWRDEDGVTRYGLDVGELAELWETRLEVVDPCVIQRTC
jgi:hypothetical protein